MIKLQMQKVEHSRKIGSRCEYIEPNVKESCYLYDGDELVGVYISDVKKDYPKLLKREESWLGPNGKILACLNSLFYDSDFLKEICSGLKIEKTFYGAFEEQNP